MLTKLKYALTHPISVSVGAVSAVGGALGVIFQVPFISDFWGWLLAYAPGVFTFSSIFGRFVAPHFESVPAEPFLYAAAGFGLIFGGYRLYKALQALNRRVLE